MTQDEMIECELSKAAEEFAYNPDSPITRSGIGGASAVDPEEAFKAGGRYACSIIRERMGAKDEAIAAFLLCIRDLPKDSCARRAFSHVEALSRAALTTEGEKSDG